MRAWAAFALFGLLLIGSLAVRGTTVDLWTENDNLEQAIIQVAEAQGLAFRRHTSVTDVDLRAISFDAPNCSGAVLVVPLAVTFEQEPIMRSAAGGPHLTRRYVYLERSWDSPHRLAVFFERAKFAVLAVFGLTRYVPSRQLLLVEAPPGCEAADGVDWRLVWDRRMLQSPKADAAG
jgi:hypothetical protein